MSTWQAWQIVLGQLLQISAMVGTPILLINLGHDVAEDRPGLVPRLCGLCAITSYWLIAYIAWSAT